MTSASLNNGRVNRVIVYVTLIAVSIAFVAPLIWMVSTSIKPELQAASGDLNLLPRPAGDTAAIAKENYSAVWHDSSVNFPLFLRNTLIVCTLSIVGMVLSSAIVAYGFSRVKWRGRGAGCGGGL